MKNKKESMRDKGRTENVEMRERQRVIEKKKMKKVRERERGVESNGRYPLCLQVETLKKVKLLQLQC